MCLNPKYSITRSNYINANSLGSLIYNTFNCGKCAECLQMKQNEYYIRSQAQYNSTIEKNGFVYWDTLTYDQDNVPVFNKSTGLTRGFKNLKKDGILTFNSEDYKKFFKRLRINLTRAGYDIKDKLKYFFVSEYGGITHRPHYHFILYIINPDITPNLIETFIRKSWNLGRIDEDKGAEKKVINGYGAINYVAKYVSKDDEYTKVLNKFAKKYKLNDEELKLLQPFHKQSQGFGIDIISQQDYDFMFKTGKMRITDESGYHDVDIPLYIKRKLWYECYKGFDNKLHWRLNEKGIEWYKSLVPTKVNDIIDRFTECYNNLEAYIPKDDYSFNIRKEINNYLDGRSLKDLAFYQFYYRGQLKPLNMKECPSPEQMINSKFGENYKLDLCELQNLHEKYDLSGVIDTSQIYYRTDKGFTNLDGETISFDNFMYRYTINQSTYYEFRNFDYIISLLSIVNRMKSEIKQFKYEDKQKIKARLRSLKNKYRF